MTTILGICGSPRKAATYHALEIALQAAASTGRVTTEMIALHNKVIQPCNQCDWCQNPEREELCRIKDDMTDIYPLLTGADAIIFASPVYSMNITPQMDALFSRMRPFFQLKGGALKNKLASAIAVGGSLHGGQETTVMAICHACLARGLIFVGNEPGNYSGAMVWSNDRGAEGVDEDVSGCESLENLGIRLAEVAGIMKAGNISLNSHT